MNIEIADNILLPLQKLVTGRTAVIGQSGSGKSYTVAVILEELCKKNIPFAIVDSEGEYSTLKELYNVLWAGKENDSDVQVDIENVSQLVEISINEKIPLILDISECSNDIEITDVFCRKLYDVESEIRKPYILIIEEADRFAPQAGGKGVRSLQDISRRGRKRGIGLILATQRPAIVDKNVLSQCSSQLIGKLTLINDLEAVKVFFQNKNELNSLPELKIGEFYIMGNIAKNLGNTRIIKTRKRETKDGGYTPQL